MLIYLIILFYLFLIICQIYYSIKLKEGYKCLDDDDNSQVCLYDRLDDLCNLNSRLNKYVENSKPEPPPQ